MQHQHHCRWKILLLSYPEHFYVIWLKVRAEFYWQIDRQSCYLTFDDFYSQHGQSKQFTSDLLHVPYEYFRKRLRKPPDLDLGKILSSCHLLILFLIHVTYDVIKIVYLTICHLNRNIWYPINPMHKLCSFAPFTGVDIVNKWRRARSKASKLKIHLTRRKTSKLETRCKRRARPLLPIAAFISWICYHATSVSVYE